MRSALPHVASTPVISQPVRSDAPTRAPGQGEASGAFGEILDASSAAPDPGGGKPASGKSKEASAPAAQSDHLAETPEATNTSPPPAIGVDLALLAPELAVDGSAAIPVVATETDDGNATASGDAVTENTKCETNGDAANVITDPKAAEVTLTVGIAPPPAPATTPVQAETGATATSSSGLTASITAPSGSAPAEAGAPAADGASLPQLTRPSDTLAETASANTTTTLDKPASDEAAVLPAQRLVTDAVSGKAEDTAAQTGEAAVALPGQADAKSPPRAGAEAANVKAEGKTATSSKTEAHPAEAPHSGKTAQAHPSADASNSAEQSADADAKPAAHQPHGQVSEHASATARVAVAPAHGDPSGPGSVAQAVTAQVASTPAVFGLNAIPLASPLQTLWQPAAQRADSTESTIPISGLAVEIVSRAQDGMRRFEIRLDPPELGRIDVRLDVDRGGNVTSRLTVERAETLDLLRRDAPQLERALQHAGLNTEGGLQFSLRDQSFANRDQTQQNAATLIVPDDEPAAADAARRGYGRLIGLGGGVDIRV
jgi:flagellar hook-length control protein FliK